METQPIRPPVHISVSTELIDDYWQAASPSFSEQLSTRAAADGVHGWEPTVRGRVGGGSGT